MKKVIATGKTKEQLDARLAVSSGFLSVPVVMATFVVTWGFADVTASSAHINEQQCSFAQSANLHSITNHSN